MPQTKLPGSEEFDGSCLARVLRIRLPKDYGGGGCGKEKRNCGACHFGHGERVVKVTIHHQKFVLFYISISEYSFRLPESLLSLKKGAKIHVQCFLLQGGRYPNAYATAALPSDLAARLGIKVKGRDIQGNGVALWLSRDEDQTSKQMNTFVDGLEGIPIKETEKRARRYLPTHCLRGRAKKIYSS